jgi:hypothetical protein
MICAVFGIPRLPWPRPYTQRALAQDFADTMLARAFLEFLAAIVASPDYQLFVRSMLPLGVKTCRFSSPQEPLAEVLRSKKGRHVL